MTDRPRTFRRGALLVAGLLVLIVGVAVAAGWWTYRGQAATLERQAHGSLVAIADLKASEIGEWIAERRGDAETLHDNPAVADGLRRWFVGGDPRPFRDDVVPLLETTQDVYGYTGIVVTDPAGDVRYSTPGTASDLGEVDVETLAAAQDGNVIAVSDPFVGTDGRIGMVAAVPFVARTGRPVGGLILRMDAERSLAPIIARWTMPSDTGETLVVKREGDEVVFLNDLRHRADAALTLRLPLSSPDLPAAMALRGRTDARFGLDYRDIPVVFAAQAVPGTAWQVIAKVDRDEIVAPARTRGVTTAGLTAAGMALVAGASLLWWRLREAQAIRAAYEERDQAERSRRETEDRFRLLFESMTEGVALGRLVHIEDEADFEVMEQNDAFERHAGLAPAETLGRRIGDALGHSREQVLRELEHVGQTGASRSFETFLEHKARYLRITAVAMLPDHETLALIAEDITERKRLEQEILERTMRYELVLSGAAGAIWDWDVVGGAVYRSPSWRLQRGFAVDEVDDPEKEWGTGIHPDDAPRVWAAVTDHFEDRAAVFEAEYRVRRKDGSWMWVADRGMAQRDGAGDVVRMAGSEIDITDRKQAEQTLRESREDLNRAQTVASTGSWRLDLHNDVLLWSDENHRIFGVPIGTPMTYETFLQCVHPADREWVDRAWQAALEGARYDIEHRIVADGAVKWVRELAELEFDESGRLRGGFGTTQDITERKQVEEERQATVDLLRIANTAASRRELARRAIRFFAQLSGCAAVGIRLRDGDEYPLYEQLGTPVSDASQTREGDPRSLSGIEGESPPSGDRQTAASGTEASIPLRLGESTLGFLQLADERPDILTTTATARCQRLGTQLAVALAKLSTEEALRESERRFRIMAESSPVMMWVAGPDGRIEYANHDFRDFFGITLEGVGSLDWGRLLHPEDAEALIDDSMACLTEGRPYQAEARVLRPDGSWRWVEFRGQPRVDDSGGIVGMTGSSMDVTDRKRAEQTLIDSEHRAELLARTVGALLASDDPQALVERLCHDVMRELECEVFLNYMVDEETDRLHLNAYAGVPAATAHRIEWMDRATAEALCVFCGGGPITGDPETASLPPSGLVAANELGTYACRPLTSRGRLMGTLSFGSTRRPRFDEAEAALIAAVADHVAIAMDRRRAEAEIRRSEQTQRELAVTLNMERLRLDATIEQMDVGVVTAAGDGTLLSMNARALELHGFADHEDMLRHLDRYERDFELTHRDGSPMPSDEWPLAKALRGEFVRDYEVRVHDRRTGRRGSWSYSVTPVRSGLGQAVLIVLTIYDLTERKQLEESLRTELDSTRVLLAAATAMAESLDVGELAAALMDLVREVTGCDRVQCVLWDHNTRTFELAAEHGSAPSPGPARWLFDDLPPTLQDAVAGRQARLLSMPGPDVPRRETDPVPTDRLLFLPLVHRDRLIGYVTAADTTDRRSPTQRQLALVQSMTSLAAIAIENARLYEAQKDIAVTLQEQYIHPLPTIAGLELAVVAESHFSPELIGGDFHDVFELPHGLIAILLGDVEGKGIRAAGLAETVRSAVRALTIVSPSPRYVLNNVSRTLLQQGSEQFVTAMLMILDPTSGVTLAANAGHPSPVRLGTDGTTVIDAPVGPPLGTFAWDYAQTSFRLERGDTLIMCTDGVVEARRDDDFFGIEGVLEAVRGMSAAGPATLAERIREAAVAFAGRLRDDLQLIAVKFAGREAEGEQGPPSLTLTVPESPWRLIDIRGAARDFLDAHGVHELMIEDLLLCIEEACTNVMLHSDTSEPAQVRLQIENGVVEVIVQDHGKGFRLDQLHLDREPDPMALSGRGLFLIKSIADELELMNEGGACVRLRLLRPSTDEA